MNVRDYGYDIEAYKNICTFSFTHIASGKRWFFEVSEWKNESLQLYQFLILLSQMNARLVGYNNVSYDYKILHLIIQRGGFIDCATIRTHSVNVIAIKDKFNDPYHVWPNKRHVEQLDLMLIHHFDNINKTTSLKMIEFNMGSQNIKDLPYHFDKVLTREEADNLCVYNDHDVDETVKFYKHSYKAIAYRDGLTKLYNKDFTNHNDTKIGTDFFLMELEKAGIPVKDENRNWIQSRRAQVNCGELLLPYIEFEHPEFNRIKDFFSTAVINKRDKAGLLELKGFFGEVSCEIDDLHFSFGVGGIHASRNNEIVRSSETHDIFDWDVASYYPNVAISNKFFPEHLTELFCKIYEGVYNQRSSFDKGTLENAMLKLALNSVFGNSNAKHSVFHDPKYLCSITINGQLLLCMLAEKLMKIPDLRMIQLNTDGLTFLSPKAYSNHVKEIWNWWQEMTGLVLEEVKYKAMFIAHVNAYIAVKEDDSIKRIGAYAYETAMENVSTRELAWHKDWSKRVVAKAAEAALVRNESIEHFIRNHKDPMDFMLRTKVKRDSSLFIEEPVMWGGDVVCRKKIQVQNITRYYASTNGGYLVKVMPPTPTQRDNWLSGDHYMHKNTGAHCLKVKGKKPPSGMYLPCSPPSVDPPLRRVGVTVGQKVVDCSNMNNFADDIDYDYYIDEARKLVDPLLLGTQS